MATAKSTSATSEDDTVTDTAEFTVAPTSEDDTAADTAEFTVAPRRTVHIDGKDFGPGQTVSLDPTEGEYLRARGFFTEVDGTVAVSASGPAVNQEDGVRKDEA